MVDEASTGEAICPLCHEANQCAMAAGKDAGACWCVGETFPETLLQQLQERGERWCVCKQCLEKAKAMNDAG